MGADAVVVRHGASGAPHRLAYVRLDPLLAWSTPATAPTSTPRRRCSTPSPCGGTSARSTAVGWRSSATCCTAGGPVQRAAAAHPRRRGHAGRAADAAAGRGRDLAGRDVLRPRRRAPQGRRGDDAAGAARADERGVLPDRAGVLAALRPRRSADGDAAGPHDRDAPRADGPRHGDHRRRRRLGPLGDRRAGHQRRRGPDGRPLPAARRPQPASADAADAEPETETEGADA